MKPVLINNGKLPNDPLSSGNSLQLPSDTPFGSFPVKLLKLTHRIDETNRRIIESYAFWKQVRSDSSASADAHDAHIFANEQAVYLMGRISDEIISILWCLTKWAEKNNYPKKLKVDCILMALSPKYINKIEVVRKHAGVLKKLQDISYTFDHSFVNSAHRNICRDEPCLHAIPLKAGELSSQSPQYYKIPFAQLVNEFNRFYEDSIFWLRLFSNKYQLPRAS